MPQTNASLYDTVPNLTQPNEQLNFSKTKFNSIRYMSENGEENVNDSYAIMAVLINQKENYQEAVTPVPTKRKLPVANEKNYLNKKVKKNYHIY